MKIKSLKTGEIRTVSPATWRSMQMSGRAKLYTVLKEDLSPNVDIFRIGKLTPPEGEIQASPGIGISATGTGITMEEEHPGTYTDSLDYQVVEPGEENIESDTGEEEPEKKRKPRKKSKPDEE